MGWCSGTTIFDALCHALFDSDIVNLDESEIEEILEAVIEELWRHDWDCEYDSDYIENPIVRKVFTKLRPDWFD